MNFVRKLATDGLTRTEIYRRHYAGCKGGMRCKCPWWVYGWLNGKPVRKSLQTNRADVATDRRLALEREARSSTQPEAAPEPMPAPAPAPAPPPPPATHAAKTVLPTMLAGLIQDFIQHQVAYNSIVEATVADYRFNYGRFERFVKEHNAPALEQLTPQLVSRYLIHGQLKPRSRAKNYVLLQTFFRWCTHQGYQHPVLLPPKPPRVPLEGAHRPLSTDEQRRLILACDHGAATDRAYDRAVILTLIMTGLRSVDARQLRPTNFDTASRQLRVVMQKTRGHRIHELVIPDLPPMLFDTLRVLPRSLDPAQPIFPFSDKQAFYLRVKRILKRAAVKASPHDFRVTFAVDRLAGGAQIWEVSRLLGHSSTLVTERYYIKWVQKLDDRLKTVMRNADFSHLEKAS